MKLTRFGLGNGELGGQAIQELTALINEKMSSNITKLNVNTNKVVVGMSFTNSELTEGFYFRELGLFAEDPDSGEEILYMYANAAEASDYIDSNTGKVIEENLDVEIIISDVENITATIDGSLVYLTLNGDASNTTVTFTESEEKTNIESGDTLSVLFGKIKKWFSSFAKVAFSGSYNDADDKPQINGFEIKGNKTSAALGLASATHSHAEMHSHSNKSALDAISQDDITNWNNKAETNQIPKKTSQLTNDSNFAPISYSTEELEPGVSPLATGQIHFTYE